MDKQHTGIQHARAMGILFLVAFVFYGVGRYLFDASGSGMKYAGSLLILLNSAVVFSIGILFRKTLGQYNVWIGAVYLSGRLVEALLLACIVKSVVDVPNANEDLGYFAGMAVLGIVSVFMCLVLYKQHLTPKWLAAWGIIGYSIFSIGFLLELFGKPWSMYLLGLGGLWEIFFGCWLIFKNGQYEKSNRISSWKSPKLLEVYSWGWMKNFIVLKREIDAGLPGLEYTIEHVGSTSVPGLAAKPIIDIDIIYTEKSEFEKIKSGLEALGYYHAGNQGVEDREVFKRSDRKIREVLDSLKHHLYVCPVESKALERHLLSRNFLREHAWAREKYQQLKYEIAKRAGEDRKRYAVLKELHINDFIDSIIEEEKRKAS